jgi:hypothetical protein
MSGVLRLSNNVTGRSTIIASASNDQTFTLPATGGTLLAGGSSLEVIFPSGTEALPGLHVESDVNTGLYSPTANTLGISTDGTEAMRIDSAGRLLVGTTTEGQVNADELTIANNGDCGLTIRSSSSTTGNVYFSDGTSGTAEYSGAIVYDHSTDSLELYTGNGSERMRIDSSGNVFIGGTTAASAAIALNADGSISATGQIKAGNLTASSTTTRGASLGVGTATGQLLVQQTAAADATNNLIRVFHGNVATVNITGGGSATFAGTVQSGAIDITQNSTGVISYDAGLIRVQRLSTNSTSPIWQGYVGTSKTSEILANGSATFEGAVQAGGSPDSGANAGVKIYQDGAVVAARPGNTVNDPVWLAYRSPTNATTSRILATGDAYFAGTVTASNVSDIRFKENITDASPQLADAVALGSQLKNWNWKDEAPLNEELRAKRFLGLVAQEAEKVCPGLTYVVPRTKQGKELTPAVLDEEGKETKAATYEELDDSYKAINHDILVMKLLGAVAELSAKVAALEAG